MIIQPTHRTEYVGIIGPDGLVYDPAVNAAAEQEQRYEFVDVLGENKPVYIGRADPDTPTSGEWRIQKYTWVLGPNGSESVPARVQSAVGSWDDRASLFA